LKVNFIFKNKQKSPFEPPFWDSVVGYLLLTLSIARLKAHGRLRIRHDWTFSLYLTIETLQAKICWSRHFWKGGESLLAQISYAMGRCPPTTVYIRIGLLATLSRGSKIFAVHCLVLWQSSVRVRQTDGQNYDYDSQLIPKTALA